MSGIFFSSLAAFSAVESASADGQKQQQQPEESFRIAFNVTNGSLGIKLQVATSTQPFEPSRTQPA